MIESYSFGRIVVDGQTYTSDLIIYPDRVEASWWRKEGHRLHLADLKGVMEASPEVVIVGTGYFGDMKVPPETKEGLESQGVEVMVEKTGQAWQTYNRLAGSRKVVAAFHLTC
jgi:hypothetical protein